MKAKTGASTRRSTSRGIVFLLVVLALGITVAACGSSRNKGASSKEVVLKMGTVLPITGNLSTYGPSLTQSAKLAVEQVDSALKEDRIPFHVVLVGTENGQTSPQASVEAAQKLVASGAKIIIGGMSSSSTIAMVDSVGVPQHIIFVSPTSDAASIAHLSDDHLLWSVYPLSTFAGHALAQAIGKAVGRSSTVNIAGENNSYGVGLVDAFDSSWKSLGGKIGVSTLFSSRAPSLQPVADKLTSVPAAAYVLVVYPDVYQRLAPALVATGKWSASKTWTESALDDPGFLKKLGGPAVEGLRGTVSSGPSGQTAAEFKKFFTEHSNGLPFTGFEGTSYDAVVLAALAAVRGRSGDPDVIKDYMREVSGPSGVRVTWNQLAKAFKAAWNGKDVAYDGAWGEAEFRSNGTPGTGIYNIWEYSHGKVKVIGTVHVEG